MPSKAKKGGFNRLNTLIQNLDRDPPLDLFFKFVVDVPVPITGTQHLIEAG